MVRASFLYYYTAEVTCEMSTVLFGASCLAQMVKNLLSRDLVQFWVEGPCRRGDSYPPSILEEFYGLYSLRGHKGWTRLS